MSASLLDSDAYFTSVSRAVLRVLPVNGQRAGLHTTSRLFGQASLQPGLCLALFRVNKCEVTPGISRKKSKPLHKETGLRFKKKIALSLLFFYLNHAYTATYTYIYVFIHFSLHMFLM